MSPMIGDASARAVGDMLGTVNRDVRWIRLGRVALIWFKRGPAKDRTRAPGAAR